MKNLTPKQKASIALASLRGEKLSKLCSDYQLHPNQIIKWRKVLEDEGACLFVDKRKKENHQCPDSELSEHGVGRPAAQTFH